MRPFFTHLSLLTTLLLLSADLRAQPFPGTPPALDWNGFLKCETVVVGKFKSNKGAALTLEIVEVLRGKAGKPGELLEVKLSQSFAVKFSPYYGNRVRARAQMPRICYVQDDGPRVQEISIVYDADSPTVYFFPRADKLVIDRPSQMQPDHRDGWRQALCGKPVEVALRLMQEFDPKLREQAVTELFRTRDRRAIAALIDVVLGPPNSLRWIETQTFAERLLVCLGDQKGDLYEPVLKAITGEDGKSYDQTFRLGRVLARADSKRAAGDFKKLLESGSRVSRDGLCWCLHSLESEEGLDLTLEQMAAGQSQATNSLVELMFNRQGISVPMVPRARIQELAVPRIQKLLRARTLPKEIHGHAMYHEYFAGLVEEFRVDQHFRLPGYHYGVANRPSRKGLPDWNRTVYEASGDLEPLLKADLVEGRKLLRERLANPEKTKPHDLLVSQHLAYHYGDAPLAAKYKKPTDPIIRYRDTSTANYHRAPYSVFKKLFAETPKLSDAYWARLIALFPHHPREYFDELQAMLQSDDLNHRHFAAVQQLQTHFYWDFDLDPKDFAPVRERKLAAIKPLFEEMSRGNLLEMRAAVLRHFGIKLDGPPSKAWLPALHKAALSWNQTIKLNAFCVLGMIDEDPEVMPFANYPLSTRQKELEAYLKNREALRKEAKPLTPARLQTLWRDLDSDDRALGYSSMQAALDAPQSVLPWFRKHLKESPADAPDPKVCAAHIKNLASPMFKVRSESTDALKKLGPGVVPHLRKALKNAPDLELRRRLEEVLSEFSLNDGRLREVRVIQVLEYMPGQEARALLKELADGPKDHSLTHEAQAALRRVRQFWQW